MDNLVAGYRSLLIAAHEPALAQVVAPRTMRLAGGLLHEEVPA